MNYAETERADIIGRATCAFRNRLNEVLDTDSLNDFLKLFEIELEGKNPTFASYNRRTKILVFGALSGRKKIILQALKNLELVKII